MPAARNRLAKIPNNRHQTHTLDEVTVLRDNPIHTFFFVLSGNVSDQLVLGEYRWFPVALYWVLLIGSVAIAYANWRMDATQRTGTHISIYAMRLNLVAKRLIPGSRYDGLLARALAFAS
jgi:hypothetical protein